MNDIKCLRCNVISDGDNCHLCGDPLNEEFPNGTVNKPRYGARYWTDYPLLHLGDKPNEPAPVRQVTVIGYDGDKCCDVLVGTVELQLKCGYLYTKPQRMTSNGFIKICEICGDDVPKNFNYCSRIECAIELNKRDGGIAYTPNGLPISCIRADCNMYEHEHGDHPNYIFPIEIEYVGPKNDDRYKWIDGEGNVSDMEEEWRYVTDHQTHALLYTNGSIAVTIYETCSSAWMLNPFVQEFKDGVRLPKEEVEIEQAKAIGVCLGGNLLSPGEWKITQESLIKIRDYLNKKES